MATCTANSCLSQLSTKTGQGEQVAWVCHKVTIIKPKLVVLAKPLNFQQLAPQLYIYYADSGINHLNIWQESESNLHNVELFFYFVWPLSQTVETKKKTFYFFLSCFFSCVNSGISSRDYSISCRDISFDYTKPDQFYHSDDYLCPYWF